MYITPAIQDFQPIHPAVYLRAADPARPVLRDWWVTDPYLQLQEPSGALFIFKGQRLQGGWSLSLSVHGYRYRGISGIFQRYRYILRCPGVHKEEGTVRSRSGDHHNNILQKLLFRKKTRTFIRYQKVSDALIPTYTRSRGLSRLFICKAHSYLFPLPCWNKATAIPLALDGGLR